MQEQFSFLSSRFGFKDIFERSLQEKFSGKSILITGGTGTFGKALAKRLLKDFNPSKVIILSRDEWKQWDMRSSNPIFDDARIRYFLGDVRDKERLMRGFKEVDFVVHAAALKQVPAAEYNPTEFVKTNIGGAMNVIDAAIDSGVKEVIALSTDKACAPANLYGATKLCSDKLFIAANSYVGKRGYPVFSVVRYGNVLGSRGSILNLWQQRINKGCKFLSITDARMTRFWITLEQAVNFVLLTFLKAEGGEIFVPKIPSMKIIDLAHAFAPGIPTEICGIREGEKIHENLISLEEARIGFDCGNFYVIVPPQVKNGRLVSRKLTNQSFMTPLEEGFQYCSDLNSQWLSEKNLRELLKEIAESDYAFV